MYTYMCRKMCGVHGTPFTKQLFLHFRTFVINYLLIFIHRIYDVEQHIIFVKYYFVVYFINTVANVLCVPNVEHAITFWLFVYFEII